MPDEAAFCVECGSGLKRVENRQLRNYRCHRHGDRFAATFCSLCGKLICSSCRTTYAGKDVCKLCYIKRIIPSMYLALLPQARPRDAL